MRLVGLTNDVSLRNLIPGELAKGFGFFQSKPASAFSPVFVTPDALGDWWKDGKLHRKLMVDLNGKPFGRAEAGEDMTFDFGTLIAHAAKTREAWRGDDHRFGHRLEPGCRWRPGQADRRGRRRLFVHRRSAHGRDDPGRGGGDAVPEEAGDTVRIWAEDDKHHPIFGVIEQTVE